MSECFPESKSSEARVKAELDLCNLQKQIYK